MRIGIIGHRKLNKEKVQQYKIAIYNQLEKIKLQHKNIIVYSALADGADRLLIHEAIKLQINFIAVLPMKRERYYCDFSNSSKEEFNDILKMAKNIIVMSKNNNCREIQYEMAGKYISDISDILFVLWDGTYNGLQGGTSETIKYHLKKNKPLWHLKVDRDTN